jgi:hypothetical protein
MITWSEIESECGNYRAGFVAVFRRYEGQPTDEKDARGRIVRVSMASFARHLGIDKMTFSRWVRRVVDEPLPPSDHPDQMTKRRARQVVRNDPAAVVDAIMEAPAETRDEIYHEVKLRRAGEDRSTAHRKATEATVDETTEPIRKSFAAMGILGLAEVIAEWTHDLQQAIDEGADLQALLPRIREEWERFGATLEMAEMVTGVQR